MNDRHSTRTRLGDLQLAIMRILWDRGEATVVEMHEALERSNRALAPTTVATMLRKMEAKGVVDHREDGRTYIYRPAVNERDVHRTMVGDLTERLFGGDAAALVSHLIEERELDHDDLRELFRLIEQREAAARRGEATP